MKTWLFAIIRLVVLAKRRIWVSGLAHLLLLAALVGHTNAHAGIGIHILTGQFGQITQHYDTVYVNDPYRQGVTMSLLVGAGEASGEKFTYDLYYGVMLPDGTLGTWLPVKSPERTNFKIVAGLQPLVQNASLNFGEQPPEVQGAGVAISHIFSPTDPLGQYLIFCIVTRPGTNPMDFRNWAGFGTKILTVK